VRTLFCVLPHSGKIYIKDGILDIDSTNIIAIIYNEHWWPIPEAADAKFLLKNSERVRN
jgi:hypothetical protein